MNVQEQNTRVYAIVSGEMAKLDDNGKLVTKVPGDHVHLTDAQAERQGPRVTELRSQDAAAVTRDWSLIGKMKAVSVVDLVNASDSGDINGILAYEARQDRPRKSIVNACAEQLEFLGADGSEEILEEIALDTLNDDDDDDDDDDE